jgi:2-isopropylmalate synthase
MGYDLDKSELDQTFNRFKELADKKKTITDADLEALVTDEIFQPTEIFSLDGLQVSCGTIGMPTATVRLIGPDGELKVQASIGTGPVDAVYKAIDEIIKAPNTLLEFSIRAITEGIDALGEVTVRLKADNGKAPRRTSPQSGRTHRLTFGGHGADTDIIVACAKAYLAAMNKLLAASGRYGVQEKATEIAATP